jgi:hypothetical protein
MTQLKQHTTKRALQWCTWAYMHWQAAMLPKSLLLGLMLGPPIGKWEQQAWLLWACVSCKGNAEIAAAFTRIGTFVSLAPSSNSATLQQSTLATKLQAPCASLPTCSAQANKQLLQPGHPLCSSC